MAKISSLGAFMAAVSVVGTAMVYDIGLHETQSDETFKAQDFQTAIVDADSYEHRIEAAAPDGIAKTFTMNTNSSASPDIEAGECFQPTIYGYYTARVFGAEKITATALTKTACPA